MNLKRKLSRLASPVATAPTSPPPSSASEPEGDARVSRLRARLRARRGTEGPRVPAIAGPRVSMHEALGVECITGDWGQVQRVRLEGESALAHGAVRLSRALEASGTEVAALALDGSLRAASLENLVVFDTETTGLMGGTGTLAFLIGLGWFEGTTFVTEQVVVPSPGEEASALAYVAHRLRAASCWVSYNGKSYDWPLLRSRLILNRLEVPTPRPHLDLLHVCRRLYSHRLPEVTLIEVEAGVLGFQRQGDIPGHAIPTCYFRFLRQQNASVLKPVMHHNLLDVRALAALLGLVAERYRVPELAGRGEDPLRLARVAQRAGAWEKALGFAAQATLDGGLHAVEALRLSARLLQRMGRCSAAAECLRSALACSDTTPWVQQEVHLALAKLYEHRLGDLDRAWTHAQAAGDVEGEAAAAKRAERLTRRRGGRTPVQIAFPDPR